jgi:hypothetical protein
MAISVIQNTPLGREIRKINSSLTIFLFFSNHGLTRARSIDDETTSGLARVKTNEGNNMKKTSVILALALTVAAWSALAQDNSSGPQDGPPDGPPRGRHHHPPADALIIRALDTNHDGVIDAAEIANAPAALLTLDTNGDGKLTPDEYLPHRPNGGTNAIPTGPDGKLPRPPIIAALDPNGDGVIDAQEIANAPAELLTLDKNGDGKLTPDEWRPQRPPEDGPPPGDGGGPGGDDNGGGGPPPGGPPQ